MTATHTPLEHLFRWEEVLEDSPESVAATGGEYEPPEAIAERVERAEEKVIQIFYVFVTFLLTLAASLAIAVTIYCWRKGGRVVWWVRINPFKVKIACRIRR
jgi:hypothetical protein